MGAVVVNYRAADHVMDCVASLRAEGVAEIVVVDNDSGDDCREVLAARDPAARFVGLTDNRGYGAAANRGVDELRTDLVLVCNPDLVIQPGAVEALRAALDDPTVGVAGPRIERPDGSRYPSARTFPSIVDSAGHAFLGLVTADNPYSRRYLRTHHAEAGAVDWVSGACLAVRRRAFAEVGGFDESYFMFLEDVDLCWRLHRQGWEVVYEPGARVTHVEGVSRATAPYRMILAHHRSLLRYGWRSTSGRQRLWMPLVTVGLTVRVLVLFARQVVSGHPQSPSVGPADGR